MQFCEYCDKGFKRLRDLTAHELTHSGEVHSCPIKGCKYKSADIRYVRIHLKTLTPLKKNMLTHVANAIRYSSAMNNKKDIITTNTDMVNTKSANK